MFFCKITFGFHFEPISFGLGWGGDQLDLCEQDLVYVLPTSLYTSLFTHNQ